MLHGIDVSQWQRGRIKWGPSIGFAYAKATEGSGYTDPAFREHVDGARRASVPIGAYHFARPKSDPIRAAQFALATAEGMDLPLALDIEVTDGLSPERVKEWCSAFLWVSGPRTLIYSYPSFLKMLRIVDSDPMSAHELWIAHYTKADQPDLSSTPWSTWRIWQYLGDAGRHPDVMGPCDLNRFQGDFDLWAHPHKSRELRESKETPSEWGPRTATQVLPEVF